MANKPKKIPYAKLKGLRAERGLFQADIAKIVGISDVSYQRREAGELDWHLTEMLILRRYFKLSMDDLFGE